MPDVLRKAPLIRAQTHATPNMPPAQAYAPAMRRGRVMSSVVWAGGKRKCRQ